MYFLLYHDAFSTLGKVAFIENFSTYFKKLVFVDYSFHLGKKRPDLFYGTLYDIQFFGDKHMVYKIFSST